MKITKFGTMYMENDQLVLKEFCFEIDERVVDIGNKREVDRHALLGVISYLIEVLVEREMECNAFSGSRSH